MNNHIGIVLATFNGAKYIKQQLISIINQSMKPDLIVVSDGASQDQTVNICNEILSKSGINYLILTSNIPLSVKDNFEKGLRNCKTDYIFFSDQDDIWLPTKIEDFMNIFNIEKADLVFCNAYIVDDNLKKKGKTLWETIGYNVYDERTVYDRCNIKFLREILKHNVVTGMCMAVNGKMINQILPFSQYAIHDVWIAHVVNCFGKIVALNKCEILYRQHESNVIGSNKSLQKTLKRRKGYYDRVRNRLYFIRDIRQKDIYCNEVIKEHYEKYIIHMLNRIYFMEKKVSFYKIFFFINNYKIYEYKWYQIFVKDIYTRLTKKKG